MSPTDAEGAGALGSPPAGRLYMYCPAKVAVAAHRANCPTMASILGQQARKMGRPPLHSTGDTAAGSTLRGETEVFQPLVSKQEKLAAIRLTYSRKLVQEDFVSPMRARKAGGKEVCSGRLRRSVSVATELSSKQKARRVMRASAPLPPSLVQTFPLPASAGKMEATGRPCTTSRRSSSGCKPVGDKALRPSTSLRRSVSRGRKPRRSAADAPASPEEDEAIAAKRSALSRLASAYVPYMSAQKPSTSGMAATMLQSIGGRQFDAWKKRHKVEEGTKVFHISMGERVGAYEPMRAGLLSRGWVENSDPSSNCFDFRWVNTGVNYEVLLPQQVVNHFEEQHVITTKAGLCETLRDCRWATDADSLQFYPRCYNLWDNTDRTLFMDDFRETAAVALLQRTANGHAVPADLYQLAFAVCRAKVAMGRYLVSDDDLGSASTSSPSPTKEEWNAIIEFVASHPEVECLVADDATSADVFDVKAVSDIDDIVDTGSSTEAATVSSPQADAAKSSDRNGDLLDDVSSIADAAEAIAGGHASSNSDDIQVFNGEKHVQVSGQVTRVAAYTAALPRPAEWPPSFQAEEAAQVLAGLARLSPQASLNGSSNVWIVKPGGKSRGRGIALFNSLPKLLQYTATTNGSEKWVAQKYIERPLIIQRRKFDIRQWVLVTSWNPLTVWFYDECYLRFTADEYDIDDLDIFAHLSNNSISKHREVVRDDEITNGGNMWTVERFQEHLDGLPGVGGATWGDSILPQMKAIVRHSLQTAKTRIAGRRNSCSLYGYDFMIDEAMQVWLLEINKSPTMEPSTPITKRLCEDVLEDTLKVLIDLPAAGVKPSLDPVGSGPAGRPDDALDASNGTEAESAGPSDGSAGAASRTGKWSCIVCDSVAVGKPAYFPGHNRLVCSGQAVKLVAVPEP